MAFLYPLFFTSGIPALLYQVVWQRSLFTIYGTNTESATAVVAAFLLGLGLGAFVGGWAASRWPTQLLIIYVVIEFVIGLFGFVSLQIFDWVGRRFTAASMAQTGIVAFALLMGATLPILVAFLVAHRGHVGSGVGILYFVNTLGSAFDCVLAAEFLMEALGQRGTVAVAATLNLVVGGGAIILGCMLRGGKDADKQAREEAARRVGAFVLSKPRAALLAGRPLSRLADASPTHARLVPTALLAAAAVTALECVEEAGQGVGGAVDRGGFSGRLGLGVAAQDQGASIGGWESEHRAFGWPRTCRGRRAGSAQEPEHAHGHAGSPAGSRPKKRQRCGLRCDPRVDGRRDVKKDRP